MRPWASWTAKTAVLTLTAGLAATVGGLSGVALAASGGSAANSGGVVSDQAATPAGIPGDICTDTGALLGIAGAACRSVTPGPAATRVSATRASTAAGANAAAGQEAGQGTGTSSAPP